jgi:hypothetical protein
MQNLSPISTFYFKSLIGILAVHTAAGFGSVPFLPRRHASISRLAMNTLLEPTRPAQIIPKGGIPKLYAYDHCPFCARVRFILGAKNIKHHVVFLANDDKETPTKLVR